MLIFVGIKSSVRCLNFPLENSVFELNFKARSTACYRDAHVRLTHFAERTRLATSSRKGISLNVSLFSEMTHVVNRVTNMFLRLSSGILCVRFLVLTRIPS